MDGGFVGVPLSCVFRLPTLGIFSSWVSWVLGVLRRILFGVFVWVFQLEGIGFLGAIKVVELSTPVMNELR